MKIFMKKLHVVLFITLAFVLILTACGEGGKKAVENDKSSSTNDKPVTLENGQWYVGNPVNNDEGVVYGTKDGAMIADGEPFIKTSAWWGVNTWMGTDEITTRGNFLFIKDDEVGTDKDFYTMAGFNTCFYNVAETEFMEFGINSETKLPYGYNFRNLDKALRRAEETGKKLTLHFDIMPTRALTEAAGWEFVYADGTTKKVAATNLNYYNYDELVPYMEELLKPLIDHVRNNKTLIDYKVSNESTMYDENSGYDEWSVLKFREYISEKYTLEELSLRYGGESGFYTSVDEIYPPIERLQTDSDGKPLENIKCAVWDFSIFQKQIFADCYTKFFEMLQRLDGKGRPIFTEYNHIPMSRTHFDYHHVAAQTGDYHVGSGSFTIDMAEIALYQGFMTECAPAPWFTNEIEGRAFATEMRKNIWANVAFGSSGYNIWAFPNVIGAEIEFQQDPMAYTPESVEQLPTKFWEVVQTNKMLECLTPVLASAKIPDREIAFLFLEDSTQTWENVQSYFKDIRDFLDIMTFSGYGDRLTMITQYHLANNLYEKYKIIFMPQTPRISQRNKDILAEYVNNGGTLVLMGNTDYVDELTFIKANPLDSGILNKVAGIYAYKYETEEVNNEFSYIWNGQKIYTAMVCEAIPSTAETIAVFASEGSKSNDKIAVTKNKYGSGYCYYFGGAPLRIGTDSDGENSAAYELVAEMLTQAGVKPNLKITSRGALENELIAPVRLVDDGILIFLIDDASLNRKLTINIDPVLNGLDTSAKYYIYDFFGDFKAELNSDFTFDFTILPDNVNILYVTTKTNLDEYERPMIFQNADDKVWTPDKYKEIAPTVGNLITEKLEWLKTRNITVSNMNLVKLDSKFMGLNLSSYSTVDIYKVFGAGNPLEKNDDEREPIMNANSGVTPMALGYKINPWIYDIPAFLSGAGNKFMYVPLYSSYKGLSLGDRTAKGLYFFFSGTGGDGVGHFGYVGAFRIHYTDGTSEIVPLVDSITQVGSGRPEFFSDSRQITQLMRYEAFHDNNDKRMALYMLDWQNPHPEKTLQSFDIEMKKTGNPCRVNDIDVGIALWGVTMETD